MPGEHSQVSVQSHVGLLVQQALRQALLQDPLQGPRHHRGGDHPHTETSPLLPLPEIHSPVTQVLRVERELSYPAKLLSSVLYICDRIHTKAFYTLILNLVIKLYFKLPKDLIYFVHL